MAINKKLKKFDDNGTYRNFLTTSDFERPDVSSIGAGSVPQNLDVEYNPTRMLFLNAKYRLFPTSTKIEFVIDTITNGTVGCWYKPSTGSTYTKLNNTDLTFYSAYTQNRVTNLTFDTIGASNLSDECNIIYALSAKSSADASITASDTCVQRGLISLTGENFHSSGGSINYQIKTAPGNPWKITNTNSWLTFSTLTGTGPTTVTITATEWTDTLQGRTGTVKLEYTDMEYSVQATIIQNKLNKYFYVGNSAAQATTTACTYASTVGSADTTDKYVYYKMAGYTVSSLSLDKDEMFSSVSFDGGDRIKFALSANPNHSDRTGTILVKDGSTIISQITVTQQAKRVDYFYVGNTASEAATSALTACTYASTVSSAANSYVVYYSTNYTAAELGTLTFQPDTMFQSASFATSTTAGTINVSVKENSMGSAARSGNIWVKSGSTNVAKITFNQSAGATPPVNYFYWGNSGSATTSGGNVTYNSTSVSCTYRTNYSSLTTATTDSWITSATLNAGTFTVTFPQNSTYVERTATIQIKNGSTVVGTFNLTQESAPTPNYFYWGNTGSATTTAVTVTSAATTTGNIPYRTNYSSLTTATTDTWITAATISSGNFAASFAANPNTSDRTGTVNIKSGSDVVGTINITQLAKAYFLWSNGATAITQTIAATTTIASATYTTNMTELIVESAASYTWVTAKGITNTAGNGTFSATTQQNSTTTARTATFNIKTGSTTVGKLTLEQGAGSSYFYVGKSVVAATGTAVTVTCASADTQEEGAVFAETVFYRTNLYEWATGAANLTLVKEPTAMFKDTGTWINDSNSVRATDPNGVQTTFFVQIYCYDNTSVPRTGTLTIKSGSTVLSTITVEQEGVAAPYVYVGESYQEATTSACTTEDDYPEEGGNGTFYCVTNCTTAEVNSFTLSASSNFTSCRINTAGNGRFTVRWVLGENTDKRIGQYIYIKSGSTVMAQMTVYQCYKDAWGRLDGIVYGIPLTGASYTISVSVSDQSFPELSDNVPWTIDWDYGSPVSCSPQSGYGDDSNITLTFGPNTEAAGVTIHLYAVGEYGLIELDSYFTRWINGY